MSGAQSGSDDDLEEDAITDREGVKWFRPFIRASGSTIWKHMRHDEKKTQVKCDLCPKVFKFSIAGGTSTQRRHLENVHKLNVKEEVTPKKRSKEASSQLSILDFFLRDIDFIMFHVPLHEKAG